MISHKACWHYRPALKTSYIFGSAIEALCLAVLMTGIVMWAGV